MKMNKKGQVLNGLGELAVGIAVLSIVLTVAFLILDQGAEQANNLAATSVFNETYSFTFDTFTILSGGCSLESSLSITCVYNDSIHPSAGGPYTCMNEGASSNSPNWTVDGNTINISNNALGTLGMATTVNVSYTCKTKDFSENSTAKTLTLVTCS